jgi:broad specificity phosphatase PhoE
VEITVVRHGESESNAAGLWQGQGDASLSATGHDQAKALAERLSRRSYDLVLSSDLRRAADTAAHLGFEVETMAAWRELDVGRWEGKTRQEVEADDPGALAAVRSGDDVRLGGGESMREFDGRVLDAFQEMTDRLDSDSSALLVAHGGVVASLTRQVLGQLGGFRPGMGPLENTSLTRFQVHEEGPMLISYNDAGHLGPLSQWAQRRHDEGDTLLTLIRHGETEANRVDRWQGITDGELTLDGRAQAAALAAWYPGLDSLYASPLQRAQDTAATLAEAFGVEMVSHDGVIEMHMGDWEDLTTAEIKEGWAELWAQIYHHDNDLPRGGTGESQGAAALRMQTVLQELAHRHAGAKVGVVSHGGAIRSYVLKLLGVGIDGHRRLDFVDNTSVTHVVIGEASVTLADYNVAPHLES